MSIEQIHKLKTIHIWLQDVIKRCEDEAYGEGEPVNQLLDQHIIPYLRDQEFHTFIKLSNAEANPEKII